MYNPLLLTDSYKLTHWKQYPKGTEKVFSYFESRGGEFPETIFFGLQYFIEKYLTGEFVTRERIDEAEAITGLHLGDKGLFNREGWEYILKEYDGRLPVKIRAVPEGMLIPTSNVLMTIENTDPKVPWLTNYLETLLVQVWYPTTVATLSYRMREMIGGYLDKTGGIEGLDFKLHDFGFRGVSSVESAGIGGCAHLVNFMGTDTLEALRVARDYYGVWKGVAGYSIPASEHSTITAYGKNGEADAYKNMLDQYPTGLVACVSDSYNIYDACEKLWGGKLREKVLGRDGTLVVRPDSGDPIKTVTRILNILGNKFGYEMNDKGYKVLNPKIRVIQGDGVDMGTVDALLHAMRVKGWSTDNIAFGMGGALLQKLNRDTQMFAFKCSSVIIDGDERDVFKQPVGDAFKASKAGRLTLVHDGDKYYTIREEEKEDWIADEILRVVFLNGIQFNKDNLATIRKRRADAK